MHPKVSRPAAGDHAARGIFVEAMYMTVVILEDVKMMRLAPQLSARSVSAMAMYLSALHYLRT